MWILSRLFLVILSGLSFFPSFVFALPRGQCAECSVENNGPGSVSKAVVLEALPKFSEIQQACPGVLQESTMILSPFFVRTYEQYRLQLSFIFGAQVETFIPLTTLYASYFIYESDASKPVLLVNYLAFRDSVWAERVVEAFRKGAPEQRYAASNGRYFVMVMKTEHPLSSSCFDRVKPVFKDSLKLATVSSLDDGKSVPILENVLFARGSILDTTKSLSDDQVKALGPYKSDIYSLASSEQLAGSGSTLAGELQNLEHLSLGPTLLSVADMEAVGKLKKVKRARLGGNGINDEMLSKIAGLVSMEELSLRGNPITSAGIKSIKGMKSLLSLGLANTQVDDLAMETVGDFVELENLFLAQTKITDEGIKRLNKLKKLRYLSLTGCQITDASVELLAGLPSLRKLIISGTRISEAGRVNLRAATAGRLRLE